MTAESQVVAQEDATALARRLTELRDSGAWRADPVRFRFIESLSQRIGAQPDSVRRVLEPRLQAALAEYTDRLAHVGPPDSAPPARQAAAPPPGATPLAALNAHIRQATAARAAHDLPGEAADPEELPSARRFRSAWEASRTLERLDQAITRAPPNAGPLNSHALVLRSLALMRELSPDYLRRFLVYAETLQWLERAREQHPREPASAARPARRARRRK